MMAKLYQRCKEAFEQANPHLKGQYFSFWKWLALRDDSGVISDKAYRKRFGTQPYVNTDSLAHSIKHIATQLAGVKNKLSKPTISLLLAVLFVLALGVL